MARAVTHSPYVVHRDSRTALKGTSPFSSYRAAKRRAGAEVMIDRLTRELKMLERVLAEETTLKGKAQLRLRIKGTKNSITSWTKYLVVEKHPRVEGAVMRP